MTTTTGSRSSTRQWPIPTKWTTTGNGPAGIAIDGAGNLYVGEGGNHIQKYDGGGRVLNAFGSGGHGNGQFDDPHVRGRRRFRVISTPRTSSTAACRSSIRPNPVDLGGGSGADGQFNNPTGVAADGAGNVYIADTWNDRVEKFDPSGRFLAKWGGTGNGDGQFQAPGASP